MQCSNSELGLIITSSPRHTDSNKSACRQPWLCMTVVARGAHTQDTTVLTTADFQTKWQWLTGVLLSQLYSLPVEIVHCCQLRALMRQSLHVWTPWESRPSRTMVSGSKTARHPVDHTNDWNEYRVTFQILQSEFPILKLSGIHSLYSLNFECTVNGLLFEALM